MIACLYAQSGKSSAGAYQPAQHFVAHFLARTAAPSALPPRRQIHGRIPAGADPQPEADRGRSRRQPVRPARRDADAVGEIVLKHGSCAAADFAELERELALGKGMEIGEFRIAAAPYCADISGERAIGLLSERRPNLLVEFRTADWKRVAADVREGKADLGFADVSAAERDPELTVELLRTSQGVFYCRAGHPLTRTERPTLQQLFEYPLAAPNIPGRMLDSMPKGEARFGVADEIERRFRPRILVESIGAAKRVVLAGTAIGAAIPNEIERELKEGFCVVPPVEAPWLRLNYGFILKRHRTPSPAAKAFMDIVREIEAGIPQ